MTTPAPGPLVERLYSRLPEAHRDPDAELGYPLLRYLLVAGGDADELDRLADRVETDLGRPDRADARWLPWLAQHIGSTVTDGTEVDRRALLAEAAGGFLVGTRSAIEAAARTALGGSRSATVVPFLNGDEFQIGVRTIGSETPDPSAVLRAIADAGALPAGFTVGIVFYAASWDTLEASYPAWRLWEDAGSWATIEETGSTASNTAPLKAAGEGNYGAGVAG